ncbi:MAG: branched-chain amino acid ABC transporter permease [Deltaproteobacteria bacterium]|nr:branched-chain amino acid ABC transporter permease [Deltaproteobacteria bacterium]
MDLAIYGLINSLQLALIAIGFALVYGVSRLPNFAHGALYILTGFAAWSFLSGMGIPYLPAIILSLAITAGIGAAIYQVVLIRVRGMPVSEIIATYAIGLAALEFLRWAGFRGMTYTLPAFIEGSVTIAGVPVDLQRICIIGIGAGLVLILTLFTHHTRVGLALRAIAQDERAALMLGIDSDFTATIAMALGSALAGLAALVILPLGNITVKAGYDVLIFAIAVCVCGGLGSWVGAVLAAFIIGYAQIITVSYIAPHFHLVVALLAIIFILIFKPSGLFARQKELEERV